MSADGAPVTTDARVVQVVVDKPRGALPARLGRAGVVLDAATRAAVLFEAAVLFDGERLAARVDRSALQVVGPETGDLAHAHEHVHWHCHVVAYRDGTPSHPSLASRDGRLAAPPQVAIHSPMMLARWTVEAVEGGGGQFALWSPPAGRWLPFGGSDLDEVGLALLMEAKAGGSIRVAAWSGTRRLEACADAVPSRACAHRDDHHDIYVREGALR